MSHKSTIQTFTGSTGGITINCLDSLVAKLLYGSAAANLILIIVIITRECTYRRKIASKSKTDPEKLSSSSDRYSDIESQTLGQRDRVQSVISDDFSSVNPSNSDFDEPMENWYSRKSINSSNTSTAVPRTKVFTPLGNFQGPCQHPTISKVVTLKPQVAKKKNKKARDSYIVADRGRNVIEEEPEERGESDFYVNAEQMGARRGGRSAEEAVGKSEDDEEMYVNECTVAHRK